MKRLLVFYNYPKSQRFDYDAQIKHLRQVMGKDYKVGRTSLINLEFWIKNNKLKVKTSKGLDLKKVDAVFFARWQLFQNALAAATYLQRHGIAFKPRQVSLTPPTNKLGEAVLLADKDINLPDTLITSVSNLRENASRYVKRFQFPLVLKHTSSSFGNDNFLITDETDLRTRLFGYKDDEVFVIQAYIPNDCDFRCLVLDGRVASVTKRTRKSNSTHLNNTAKGAHSELIKSPPKGVKALARRAARATGRRDFAGVDIVVNKYSGTPYVLEVNKAPRFHTPHKPERTKAIASFLKSI